MKKSILMYMLVFLPFTIHARSNQPVALEGVKCAVYEIDQQTDESYPNPKFVIMDNGDTVITDQLTAIDRVYSVLPDDTFSREGERHYIGIKEDGLNFVAIRKMSLVEMTEVERDKVAKVSKNGNVIFKWARDKWQRKYFAQGADCIRGKDLLVLLNNRKILWSREF